MRMTTSSPSLLASGWPSEVDLTKADASQKGFLSQLGLKAFWDMEQSRYNGRFGLHGGD